MAEAQQEAQTRSQGGAPGGPPPLLPRVIPVLLLRGQGLYKTIRFEKPRYVGDPINVVRIFNDKEVDELVLLDTTATAEGRGPDMEMLAQIAGECFMPLCFGGGLRTVEQIRAVLGLGVEKVALNTAAIEAPELIRRAADVVGSQSIVVAIDVRRRLFGRSRAVIRGGASVTSLDPLELAERAVAQGAGEILLTAIDREGTMAGYDLDLVRRVAGHVAVPVIAHGGAGSIEDLAAAIDAGAAAAAAGSMFVYQGKHRAVLVNVPAPAELRAAFGKHRATA